MPIVKRPGKQVAPSFGSPAALPEPGLKYATRKVGAIKQQMGANIADLGGDFAELAARVHKTKVREEFEDAKLVYGEGMNAFLAEQESNLDYATWEEATAQQHDTLISDATNELHTVQAKEQFSDWARANRSVLMYKTVARADGLLANKARSMIKIRMENYAKQGNIDGLKEHLREMEEDGLLVEEEVEFWDAEIEEFSKRWIHKQTLEQVETEALSILSESTVEAAVSFVREAITAPELSGADKRSLINLVEFFDRINEYEDKKVKLEAKRTEIAEWTTQLRGGTLDPRRIEVSEHGVSHQKQWKGYLKNSMRKAPDVDWRKYLDLEDGLFDHWNVNKTEYELATVEARYGDKPIIGDGEFDAFLKRVQLDVPRQYMVSLRTGFETIRRAGNKWKFGIRALNQEEAQRVAQARSALFDWLLEDRIAKKKETAPGEFYDRAMQLAVLFQPGRTVLDTQPDELSSLENYLNLETVSWAGIEDLRTDLRNAVKRAREGGNIQTIFQRILDTYKDNKKVQTYLNEAIRPLTVRKR